MANGHGGARKNAGRKPKSLALKLAEGNPGHRPLKKVEFGDTDVEVPKAPEFLQITYEGHSMFPSAVHVFDEIAAWLATTGCLHMIPVGNIATYALAKHFLLKSAYQLSTTKLVTKDAKKEGLVVSAFAKSFFECVKITNAAWDVIWAVVRDNSEKLVRNTEGDFIAQLSGLRVRRGRAGGSDE